MIALLKMVEQQMARDIIGPFILLVWKTSKEEILEGAKPNVKLEGKFLGSVALGGPPLEITFVQSVLFYPNFLLMK